MESGIEGFNFSASTIPSDTANSAQVVHTSEAIAKLGFSVTLFCVEGSVDFDENSYYGIRRNFEIIKIPLLKIPILGLFFRATIIVKTVRKLC